MIEDVKGSNNPPPPVRVEPKPREREQPEEQNQKIEEKPRDNPESSGKSLAVA